MTSLALVARLCLPGLDQHDDSDTSQRSYQVFELGQYHFSGITHFNVCGWIYYTYVFLLYVHVSFDAAFIGLCLLYKSTNSYKCLRLCWYTKGTFLISFSPLIQLFKINSFWQKTWNPHEEDLAKPKSGALIGLFPSPTLHWIHCLLFTCLFAFLTILAIVANKREEHIHENVYS